MLYFPFYVVSVVWTDREGRLLEWRASFSPLSLGSLVFMTSKKGELFLKGDGIDHNRLQADQILMYWKSNWPL